MKLRTVRFPDELWAALQALARERGMTVSALLRELVECAVKEHIADAFNRVP